MCKCLLILQCVFCSLIGPNVLRMMENMRILIFWGMFVRVNKVSEVIVRAECRCTIHSNTVNGKTPQGEEYNSVCLFC